MAGWFGRPQVIDHHFGRPEDLCTSPVAALRDLKYGVVGLHRVVALGNRLMLMRVELLADDFSALDAVLAEQEAQLLQRHLHTLMKLLRTGGCAGGQGSFEVVNDRQQLMDERFLLRGCARLGFLATASFEILEVGDPGQEAIPLCGEFVEARVRVGGSGWDGDVVNLRSNRERVLDFGFHKLNAFRKMRWRSSLDRKSTRLNSSHLVI